MNTQKIIDDLIIYAGNGAVDGYSDEQMLLFAEFQREWDDLECDAEGFNNEQDAAADALLEKYAYEKIGKERKQRRRARGRGQKKEFKSEVGKNYA